MSKQRPGPATDDDGRTILSPTGDPFAAILALWDARDALVTFADGAMWARRLRKPRTAAAFATVCRAELGDLRAAGITVRTSRAVQALADLGRAAGHVAAFEDDEAGRLLTAVHGVAGYPHKLRVERAKPELLPVAQRRPATSKGPSPVGDGAPRKRGRPRKEAPAGGNPPGAAFARPKPARKAPPAAPPPPPPRAPYEGPRGTCPVDECPFDAAPAMRKTPAELTTLCRCHRVKAQKWLSTRNVDGVVNVTPAMALAWVVTPLAPGRKRRPKTPMHFLPAATA